MDLDSKPLTEFSDEDALSLSDEDQLVFIHAVINELRSWQQHGLFIPMTQLKKLLDVRLASGQHAEDFRYMLGLSDLIGKFISDRESSIDMVQNNVFLRSTPSD